MTKEIIIHTPILKVTLRNKNLLYMPIPEGMKAVDAIIAFDKKLKDNPRVLIWSVLVNSFQVDYCEEDRGNLDYLTLPKALKKQVDMMIDRRKANLNLKTVDEKTIQGFVRKVLGN